MRYPTVVQVLVLLYPINPFNPYPPSQNTLNERPTQFNRLLFQPQGGAPQPIRLLVSNFGSCTRARILGSGKDDRKDQGPFPLSFARLLSVLLKTQVVAEPRLSTRSARGSCLYVVLASIMQP